MKIQVLTELPNGVKERLSVAQTPSQPVAKHLVKAGQKITVVVDGVPMTGAQVVAQKEVKRVRVGDELILEALDGSERLAELTNFYAEPNVALTGDSWVLSDGSQLLAFEHGVTSSLNDVLALSPTAAGPLAPLIQR